jgi:hypothetical protein
MSSRLSYTDTLKAMAGNLVALCACPAENIIVTGSKKLEIRSRNRTGLGIPNICYGYGIVRAIDLDKSTIFILTPLDPAFLEAKVNSLICGGSIGMPVQFYLGSADMDLDESAASSGRRREVPYVMTTTKTSSKLHKRAKRQFVPNRVAHTVLKNCIM